jgi:flagellar biosynthesis chaperone FliJ
MKIRLSLLVETVVLAVSACNTKAKKLTEELTAAQKTYTEECAAYESQLATIMSERDTINSNITRLGGKASLYAEIFSRHDALIEQLKSEIELFCVGDETAENLLTKFEKEKNWESANAEFTELKESMGKRTTSIQDMVAEHQSIMLSKRQLFSAFAVSGSK